MWSNWRLEAIVCEHPRRANDSEILKPTYLDPTTMLQSKALRSHCSPFGHLRSEALDLHCIAAMIGWLDNGMYVPGVQVTLLKCQISVCKPFTNVCKPIHHHDLIWQLNIS